jgi:HlyD family secretion protein
MSILHLKKKGETTDAGGSGDVVLSAMDKRIERRVITPQRVAVAVGVIALVALTTYAYMRFGMSRTLTVGSERLTVSEVDYGTFHEYIPVTGNVVPRTTVYLDAVEGGQVTKVYVEEGAFVTAGEPLVEFKNSNLELSVISAEAQAVEQTNLLNTQRLNANQSRLANQQRYFDNEYQIDRLTRQLERRRTLAGLDLSELAIEDLEAELVYRRNLRAPLLEQQQLDEEFRANQVPRMQAALDALNTRLEIARANLANLLISAPISGQLTLLDANMGESKSPGQRVGQVDEVGKFKVSAFIDEFYLSRVAIGQIATVEIDREEHHLEVFKIYPDVADRQFEIDLQFAGEAPEGIRRGQTVRMRLEIGQPADTLVLANGAFYDDTGGQWVFVVDPSGDFAERRAVRFGRRNPEGIEVLEGLREGEEVITSSYESLLDFDRIQFRSEDS